MVKTHEENPTPLLAQDFEILFRTRFKPLVIYALRFVKDLETAKGLVQDVFITLWEKRSDLGGSRSEAAAYLTTSVRNRCLNHLRDHKKFNYELLDFEGLYSESDSELPSQSVELADLNRQINLAIGQLPEKCRQIFVMNRFEGKKYREIADELNLSIKTVETQMSRALNSLRTNLADWLVVTGFILIAKIILWLS